MITVPQHEPCNIMIFRPSPEREVLNRVRGEFREMPALRLTLDQAMRLFALDRQTCKCVLDQLIEAGYLRQDSNGRYRRRPASY